MSSSSELSKIIKSAIIKAQKDGELPQVDLPEIIIEKPKIDKFGSLSSNIPMILGKTMNSNPMDIAGIILKKMEKNQIIDKWDIAKPGFINVHLSTFQRGKILVDIIKLKDKYGTNTLGQKAKILLEFVSVNPTGPVHVGHARGAVLGSAIANILKFSDFNVSKEYYVNDAGNQIDLFIESIVENIKKILGIDYKIPDDGYKGIYIEEIAQNLIKKINKNNLKDVDSAYEKIKKLALEITLDSIKNDLEMLGIKYDNWFSENSLISEGTLKVCLDILEKKDLLYEKDGAQWFKSSQFQTDEDVVLYKSNDEGHTYFSTDIAYHYNKFFIRKYERIVNIFGADHHSHVFRIKSALEAFEIDQNKMDTLLTQIVHFKSNNKSERFSKRTGNIYTIRDLLDVVGVDAIRFNFLHRTPESQQEFDIDLAIKESSENPVYYIQYAYARLSSIINSVKFDYSKANLNLLKSTFETNLIETLDLFPEVVVRSAITLQTHLITKYSLDLAKELQIFYENCRVLSEDIELSKARVNLVISSRIVLKNVLNLLGINAPERM